MEIDLSEIITKLWTKNDIINFFREKNNNFYFIFKIINYSFILPPNNHFNKSFLLGVLSGRKKLLPIGCLGGFNFPYFSKNILLTKDHIFKLFIIDNNLLSYLPDDPDVRYLSREFLLSVLFFGAREKYLSLYEKYKDIQFQKSTTGNQKFMAKISDEMMEHLKNFQPVNL